jgi:hypothetical protein
VTLRACYLASVPFGEKQVVDSERFEESKQRAIKDFLEIVALWQGGYLDTFIDIAIKARDTFE